MGSHSIRTECGFLGKSYPGSTEHSRAVPSEWERANPHLQDFHVAQPPESSIHKLCYSVSLHFQRLQCPKPLERESVHVLNLVSAQLTALDDTMKQLVHVTGKF